MPGRYPGHLRKRHVTEPLLRPVAERREPRVDLARRRLDGNEAVPEECDVAPLVGVQEIVERGDEAHGVLELREVRVPAQLGEPGEAPAFASPGGKSHRECSTTGLVHREHRAVVGAVDGEGLWCLAFEAIVSGIATI